MKHVVINRASNLRVNCILNGFVDTKYAYRKPPQSDYVIDEEIIADSVLSPDSHDSGINIESQYSRPMRVEDCLPMKSLPPGWERHEGLFCR